jgi:hypothetical protein
MKHYLKGIPLKGVPLVQTIKSNRGGQKDGVTI